MGGYPRAACSRSVSTAIAGARCPAWIGPSEAVTFWMVSASSPDAIRNQARIGPKALCATSRGVSVHRGSATKRFTLAYIFAAVEPGTDNAFTLVMPCADTPAMQTFLDQFSQTIAQDEHAVMILDRAGRHGSTAPVIPPNITLAPLPAYCPDLRLREED